MPTTPRIAVLAAGGHTGKMVVEALKRRNADVTPLTRLDCDARDLASVTRAVSGCDAMINLAGPFLRNGLAPVEAAIDAGVAYVDTTGEQAFMRLVRDRLQERAAIARVPIVNACAFEYAFGDLAAKAFFPKGGDALHVLYRPRSAAPSAGTKKSMMRVFAAPTLSFEEGRLKVISYGRYQKTFLTADGPRMGVAFAGGEVLTVPRHTPFRTVRTYFQTRPQASRTAKALGPLARFALKGPLLMLGDRIIDARHRDPRNEKARGEIHLMTDVGDHVVVLTPDPYDATAHMAAEGALRLARMKRGGVLAPAEAFEPNVIFDAMRAAMPTFAVDHVSAPS